ncbi:cyclopropane-fatty-acyl-phospholipid synthase family protein [Undibacterium sp. YM2]|uniref:SAM-dependent methyltransferase n=1 Tax=Undibacterium sp. YM2 TaxID=2058625 RepID=UPI001E4B9CBD|nr:class I SAM-dependent methyltransferase [Undibacterium sp. YM2]
MKSSILKLVLPVWRVLPTEFRQSSLAAKIRQQFIAPVVVPAPAVVQLEPTPPMPVEVEDPLITVRAWQDGFKPVHDYLQSPPPARTEPLKSSMCTEQMMRTEVFQYWTARMGDRPGHMHRKIWEWAFITQALKERGMLQEGQLGLGFAVGTEPLTAIFAAHGASIIATDLFTEEAQAKGWVDSTQHANGFEAINQRNLCDEKELRRLVEFKFADMNNISEELHGKFDFLWSSCAFEHLGSIEHGKQFVYNAMHCLKPGGIAVHTTEFNMSSNDDTVDTGATVLFRKRDIEEIITTLQSQGHQIEMDWDEGDGYADGHVDMAPYIQDTHLRLQIEKYVVTSIGLIVQKAA